MSVDLLKNLLLSLLEFLWVRLELLIVRLHVIGTTVGKIPKSFCWSYHLECLLELSEVSVSKVVVSLGKIIRSVF